MEERRPNSGIRGRHLDVMGQTTSIKKNSVSFLPLPPRGGSRLFCALAPPAGDCCTATCADRSWGSCTRNDFECADPDHLSVLAFEDCDLVIDSALSAWMLNNSVCNTELNTAQCGYDGGGLNSSAGSNLTPCSDEPAISHPKIGRNQVCTSIFPILRCTLECAALCLRPVPYLWRACAWGHTLHTLSTQYETVLQECFGNMLMHTCKVRS